jgi:hypothetical protein
MARIFICFIIRDTLLEGYSFWRDTPSGGILLLEGYSFWRDTPSGGILLLEGVSL